MSSGDSLPRKPFGPLECMIYEDRDGYYCIRYRITCANGKQRGQHFKCRNKKVLLNLLDKILSECWQGVPVGEVAGGPLTVLGPLGTDKLPIGMVGIKTD